MCVFVCDLYVYVCMCVCVLLVGWFWCMCLCATYEDDSPVKTKHLTSM